MKNQYIKQFLYFSCLLILSAPLTSNANGIDKDVLSFYKKQIEASIKLFEETNRKNWSYKVVRFENEEGDISSSTEVFTPNEHKSKQWALLELNGKKPTKKQLKKFTNKKLKASKKKQAGGADYSIRLREIIAIDSLTITQESDTHINMAFDVYIKKLGDDAKGKLDGLLTFDKNKQYIDFIRITNNSEFSPMFSSSITDFSMTLKFTKMSNAILPIENSLDMKGSFAFFTDIDETSIDRFSDYRYTKPQSQAR